MNTTIKHKRSNIAGAAPDTSNLELGEIAINTTDGRIFIKKEINSVESVVEIGQDWASLATLWDNTPTKINDATVNGSVGSVYKYTYRGVDRYRFVPNLYDPVMDGFYSNFSEGVLSGLIASRGFPVDRLDFSNSDNSGYYWTIGSPSIG
jgi:hypothetical protein